VVLEMLPEVGPGAAPRLVARLAPYACPEALHAFLVDFPPRALDPAACPALAPEREAPMAYAARSAVEWLVTLRKALDAPDDAVASTLRAAGFVARIDAALSLLRVPVPLPAPLRAGGHVWELPPASGDLARESEGRFYAAVDGAVAYVGAVPILHAEGGAARVAATALPGRAVSLDAPAAAATAALRRALEDAAREVPAPAGVSAADVVLPPAFGEEPTSRLVALVDRRARAADAVRALGRLVALSGKRVAIAVATPTGLAIIQVSVPPWPEARSYARALIRAGARRVAAESLRADKARLEAKDAPALRTALDALSSGPPAPLRGLADHEMLFVPDPDAPIDLLVRVMGGLVKSGEVTLGVEDARRLD
jgi:hypothetical protein